MNNIDHTSCDILILFNVPSQKTLVLCSIDHTIRTIDLLILPFSHLLTRLGVSMEVVLSLFEFMRGLLASDTDESPDKNKTHHYNLK